MMSENFAAGTMDWLGPGWDVMREVNPKLIYGTATAMAPARTKTSQRWIACCGRRRRHEHHRRDSGPPARGGTPSDIMGGIHFYAGTSPRWRARCEGDPRRGGDAGSDVFRVSSEFASYHRTGELPERRGDKTAAASAPYGRYECRDGWIALIVVSEPQWHRLVTLIVRPELADDPEYANPMLRHRFEAEINEMIGSWTAQRSKDEAYQLIRDNRIPVAPVRDVGEVRRAHA